MIEFRKSQDQETGRSPQIEANFLTSEQMSAVVRMIEAIQLDPSGYLFGCAGTKEASHACEWDIAIKFKEEADRNLIFDYFTQFKGWPVRRTITDEQIAPPSRKF